MMIDGLPYILLLLAILVGWRTNLKWSILVIGFAVISGLAVERLVPAALGSIAILLVSGWLANESKIPGLWRSVSGAVFLFVAIVMSNHLAPGFLNLAIYNKVQFSEDSIPFTMYLNFDKTLAGLSIYLFFLKTKPWTALSRFDCLVSLKTLALLIVLILPLALLAQYIRVDFKFPALGGIWILNNLFFVCLAEEALFRGLIQGGLEKILPQARIWSLVSIAVGAIAFGLAHYKGGFAYVALATVAGLFYGYAYSKTARIESAMLVHLGLNMVHFVAFSYPALIR